MAAGYSGCIPNPGHMTAPILNRERQGPTILLTTAIAVAALGTWIMYAAKPGLNWGVWTTVAAVSLVAFVRRHDRLPVIAACLTAAIIAFGATVTADPFLYGLICLAVILFLAIAMLLSIDPRIERIPRNSRYPLRFSPSPSHSPSRPGAPLALCTSCARAAHARYSAASPSRCLSSWCSRFSSRPPIRCSRSCATRSTESSRRGSSSPGRSSFSRCWRSSSAPMDLPTRGASTPAIRNSVHAAQPLARID